MRFQMIRDRQARPAACRGLIGAAARSRTLVVCALAAATCGLAVTACASPGSPGAASPAGTTASPAGTTASPGSASPASMASCVTSQLEISLTNTGALAGQAGGYLKFTNHGSTACRISGWPAVTGLTAQGQATPLRRVQSTMFGAWHYVAPVPVVTLQPGESAYAVVAADDKPAGGASSCPAPYVRLRVSPPGDSQDVTISAWLPGAGSYLPACAAADGSPTTGTSTITTLSSLPH
jgi:Protein of unknown function (DUF4232)